MFGAAQAAKSCPASRALGGPRDFTIVDQALRKVPACTDLTTNPWVQEAGVTVLNQPFFARGIVATAGGCLRT